MPRSSQVAFYSGLGIALLVEFLSALPFLTWRPWREDGWELLLSVFVYSSPFLLPFLAWSRWSDGFRWHWLDVLYAGVTALSLVSFFWIYRGFAPFNPIYTTVSSFALYLVFRMAWWAWMRPFFRQIVLFFFGLVSVEAAHGLVRAGAQLESSLHMLNENFLGMLCALTIPLWLVLFREGSHRQGSWPFRALFWTSSSLLWAALLVTNCRSAWLAVLLIAPPVMLACWWPDHLVRLSRWPAWLKMGGVGALAAAMIPVAWGLYQMRPMSAQGRLLLWRVTISIFADHPGLGVGFRQLPHYLGLYHARYFEEATAASGEIMLPSLFFDSFNAYLEVAAEYGLVGLFLWVPFWVVILAVAFEPMRSAFDLNWESRQGSTSGGPHRHPFTLGLSGLVLVYMVLSCLYFPGDVLVLSTMFLFGVAGLVTEANPPAGGTRENRA